MKRPSKFRVLLAVNRWRLAHGKAPILRLPKGDRLHFASCPLAHALDVLGVGTELRIAEGEWAPVPKTLRRFRDAFDRGEYPELIDGVSS